MRIALASTRLRFPSVTRGLSPDRKGRFNAMGRRKKIEPRARPGEFTDSGQCLLPGGWAEMLHTTIAGADAGAKRRSGAALDDVALLNRVAGKDGAAFEALYRGYYPRLAAFPRAGHPAAADRRGDPERHDAGGLAQGVELQPALAGIDLDFRHCVSARVEGAEAGRRSRRIRARRQLRTRAAPGPKACWLRRKCGHPSHKRSVRLSPDHRAVIELTYFEGYSCAEIAEIMRCPVSTVKTRMFHARRRLRMLLPDHSGDGE